MHSKLIFATLGLVCYVMWIAALTVAPALPQPFIVVCALGLLVLRPHQVIGGSCLAGLLWDLFDWQVRLGLHAVVLGIAVYLMLPLQVWLDPRRTMSLPIVAIVFTWLTAIIHPIFGKLLGCFASLPIGWWKDALIVQPLYQAAFALWLLPLLKYLSKHSVEQKVSDGVIKLELYRRSTDGSYP